MANKSILDQIESDERARLIPVAPDRRDEFSGLRGSDEYRSLLAGAMHETRRDPNASCDVTPMPRENIGLGCSSNQTHFGTGGPLATGALSTPPQPQQSSPAPPPNFR